MTFTVRTARGADAYLRRLDPATQRRIADRLRQIVADPYGGHCSILRAAGGRRSSRIANYRILYAIVVDELVIDVSAIGPRSRVYRDL